MKMSDGKSRPPVPLQKVSGRELLVCAGWLGLLSGMLEGLAYLAMQRWGILEWDVALVSVGPQQVFVSAAVNAILFLVVALSLALIGTRVTWKYWPSVTLGLFLFLSFLTLVDLSGRIQLRASLLLALGLTVQTVHWIGPRRERVLAFMRGSLLPLAGATALAGLAGWLGGPVFERVQASRLDGAPFPGIPQDWPVRSGWLKSITLEQWKLILHEQGSLELFDLTADPLERNNLALQPEQRARVERLRQLLLARLRQNAKASESD